MAQTFAQYLINSIFKPYGITINEPFDSKKQTEVLTQVFREHPDKYDEVVSAIKKLGDNISTWSGLSFGVAEIRPDYTKRDAITEGYKIKVDKAKTEDEKLDLIVEMQEKLLKVNLDRDDDATLMIESAMGGKAGQLSKIRTAPVFSDRDGKIINEVIPKSYAEGLSPYHSYMNSEESRKNIVDTLLSTSGPGVISKRFSALLGDVVVSTDDCKTENGIELDTDDPSVLDRYLAVDEGRRVAGTLVTAEIQKALLRSRILTIMVRSPQTCEATDNTICSMCYGLNINHGKKLNIGENIGLITAGALTEPATQMALSAKHSITTAKKDTRLKGIKGLTLFTDIPKIYTDKRVVSEIYGVVTHILFAPQGGKIIRVRITKPVPVKYIVNGQESDKFPRHYEYFVPPQRKIIVAVKDVLLPGDPLSDGNENIKDTARLRGLGVARTQLVNNLNQVYKNTGVNLDRRHYEVLSKSMINNVRIDKIPREITEFTRGDIVNYNKFKAFVAKLPYQTVPIDKAEGGVMGETIGIHSVGTMISPEVIADIGKRKKSVKIISGVEISPSVSSLSNTILQRDNWISNLNHTHIKDTIIDAARTGRSESIHGYNPVPAYAYGAEFTGGKNGKY